MVMFVKTVALRIFSESIYLELMHDDVQLSDLPPQRFQQFETSSLTNGCNVFQDHGPAA